MDWALDDTIVALASASGAAQRGIVRLSGPQLRHVLLGWFQPQDPEAWRKASGPAVHRGELVEVSARAPIQVDVYDWPGNRSYTGQPLVELHLVGAPPLLEAVVALACRRGARTARPGEFSLRAFLAGKLDLLQAEAVLGVIDAHDHRELTTALSQLAGGMSGRLADLRHDLLEILADLEAGLDFVEEDIEFISRCDLLGRIAQARKFVEDLLQRTDQRMQSRARPLIVLAGLPNAGKSTLFNRLAGCQAALVSPNEGTTRDFLQARISWIGLEIDLVDTAGWESGFDAVSAAAQRHRLERISSADVVIWCSAANLHPTSRTKDDELFSRVSRDARTCLRIQTQMDLPEAQGWILENSAGALDVGEDYTLPEISAKTGEGLDRLADLLRQQVSSAKKTGHQWLGMTAARCRISLEEIEIALARAEDLAGDGLIGDELIAVDIREALDHLGRILGVVYTEDILDRVFSKFCIGK